MTPELWQRLKPLYHAALDQPTGAREAFVAQACHGDPELATALQKLLDAAADSSHDFDSPVQALSSLLFPRPAILPAGTLLAHRFRIVHHLGSGGMGDVYEALDEQMEQGRIALKTIRPSIAQNAAALARFKEEVRLARKVSGPNVCRIHELYVLGPEHDAPCSAFLTMELLEGVTLHHHLAQHHPLPVDQLKQIAAQLCTALDCIHLAGIVHQDLKPGNIMLVPHQGTQRAVVTDFGLARTAVQTEALDGTHGLLPVAGTPNYMAPEQFEGRAVTPATDIYALGIILYELATGVQPYAARTPLAAAIRRSKAPTHASTMRADLPPAWDNVIACCLRYEPEQRYSSAPAVAAALQHQGKVAVRVGRQRHLLIPTTALFASAASLLVLVTCGLWLLFGRPRHRELAPDAAHWYVMGMAALREGSYLKATRLLTMVTERDPTYALAHAALADAWTELDFTDTAQREMLLASAPDEQRGLNPQERRYIDAVRTTLVRDYSAATQDYEAILQGLPKDSKAQGYVDLGRIYEKAGKVHETTASYEQAARLNPDDPAPFLHLGILRSRQRDKTGAATAFSKAEELYDAESNQEGLAEVAYQRGYAANDEEDAGAANQYLNQSLTIARQIPSVQLEVRSLAQLSSVAYNNNKDDEAIQLAHQAIDTAQAHSLEYWVTDGLVRLGNAQLDKEQYGAADTSLQEAQRRADEHNHPRLQATASLSLASLRFQQQRWDEDIHYAQQAVKYFEDYGFLDLADQSLILTARAQRNEGDYQAALVTGTRLLANLERKPTIAYQLLAEEFVGGTFLRLQRYPEALLHYDRAVEHAALLHQNSAYSEMGRAEALWSLGRCDESLLALTKISDDMKTRVNVASYVAALVANIKLSQNNARDAVATAQTALQEYPNLNDVAPLNYRLLLRTLALGEAELGHSSRADQFVAGFAYQNHVAREAWEAAQDEFIQASIDLDFGRHAIAKAHALKAETLAAEKGMAESTAINFLLAAEAAKAQNDSRAADALSEKSVDTFRHIAEAWGVPVFRQYLARPDHQQMIHSLTSLRADNGQRLDSFFR